MISKPGDVLMALDEESENCVNHRMSYTNVTSLFTEPFLTLTYAGHNDGVNDHNTRKLKGDCWLLNKKKYMQ